MVDEVEVVSWCDSHGVSALLCQPRVGLVEGLVNIHNKGIDDGLSACVLEAGGAPGTQSG